MDSGSIRLNPERLRTLASDVKFSGGNTLLHMLVLDNSHPNHPGSGHYVNFVLQCMSDVPARVVNALNGDGYSAIHLAVTKNNLTMVKKLLSRLVHIDVDARCGRADGNTALHLAVKSGHSSIVRELLNKGAGIAITNGDDETALSVAMKLRALDLVKILVSADVNRHTPYDTPLHEAALYGSLEIAEFFIDRGADVDAGDELGATPLYVAAWRGNLDMAELLIGKGADLHASDEEGATPLHAAVFSNELECATFLLDHGAHLHATDVFGWTPLHAAAYVGDVDFVRALLDRGAGVNAMTVDGKTPLDLARERQKQSCIDVLEKW